MILEMFCPFALTMVYCDLVTKINCFGPLSLMILIDRDEKFKKILRQFICLSEKVRVQFFKMELITDFFQIPNHLFSGGWEENRRGWFTLNGEHYYDSDAEEYINVDPVVRLLINHVLKRADLHKNKCAIIHLFSVVYLLQ